VAIDGEILWTVQHGKCDNAYDTNWRKNCNIKLRHSQVGQHEVEQRQ